MALYQDPVTGKDMAIVHACRPMMLLNAERSTVITESWHLQHYIDYIDANDAMKGKILVPVYNPIPADQLVGRVRVYMETQQANRTRSRKALSKGERARKRTTEQDLIIERENNARNQESTVEQKEEEKQVEGLEQEKLQK